MIKSEKPIDLHDKLCDVDIDEMINLIVIFAKYLVNLSDVECSECADFWVEPESVVASGVACLPAVAEPAHDFVNQEVRVEIAVEVQVISVVDPAFSRLHLARL